MPAPSERDLVAFLAQRFAATSPGVDLGIGDDAAVLQGAGSEPWVCSVDASVQGVHFDLAWLSLADVGYRSFQAAASDLAAMGAAPSAALSALILPRGIGRDAIDQLTAGQAQASLETGCPIVGGNVSRGSELSITTTVLGRVQEPLTRSGARPGDQLWIIGEVGLAAAGLGLLRRGVRAGDEPASASAPAPGHAAHGPESHGAASHDRVSHGAPSASPTERALARCIQAWRRPQARLAAGRELPGLASAAIDLSDGLASDAQQLARASGVRVIVQPERLLASLHPALFVAARRLGRGALALAIEGGEDYALLATGPASRRPAGAQAIGYVTRGSGALLAAPSGLQLLRGGFDHLR